MAIARSRASRPQPHAAQRARNVARNAIAMQRLCFAACDSSASLSVGTRVLPYPTGPFPEARVNTCALAMPPRAMLGRERGTLVVHIPDSLMTKPIAAAAVLIRRSYPARAVGQASCLAIDGVFVR